MLKVACNILLKKNENSHEFSKNNPGMALSEKSSAKTTDM